MSVALVTGGARRIGRALGWHPRIHWREGIADLHDWLAAHRLETPSRKTQRRRAPA